MKLTKDILKKLYLAERKSVFEIQCLSGYSQNTVNYWLKKYGIQKRTISEAVYIKNNPNGDPFKIKKKLNKEDENLLGLGLGLYWGEGNKKNKYSIRVSNTDPRLIKKFMDFLVRICGVKRDEIDFSLLIFNDISVDSVKNFWMKELNIKPEQIKGKATIIKSYKLGTYKQKAEYGVIILQYHNKKLRDIICNAIEKL